MKLISLTQGRFSMVDDEDYENLCKHKWCVARTDKYWYAVRSVRAEGIKKRLYLHRVIAGVEGLMVDHINHDTLDNRKENLRAATPSQNCLNRRTVARRRGSSRGVQYSNNKKNPWKAMLWNGKKMIGLGYFPTEKLAYETYKKEAEKLHGKFFYRN